MHQDKLVDNVGASAFGSQLGSNFMITAAVKQGVDVAKVEAAIDEELQTLLKDGPTADELERARTSIQAGWIRGVERIGGFGGKADALAECAVYTGDPGCFRDSLKTLGDATVASVRGTGNTWLGAGKGSHTLVVNPGKRVDIPEEPAVTPAPFKLPAVDKKYTTTASTVDRKAGVPVTASFPDLKFPSLQRATLKNGTKVVLAERHDIPVVQMSYEFRGGQSADPAAKLGTASFAMGLLDEGAGDLDALAFQPRRQRRSGQQQRLPVVAEAEPGAVGRAVRRHAAQAALRAGRHRPREGPVDRRHQAGEGEPGRDHPARGAGPGLRR